MSENLVQGNLFEIKNKTQTGPVTCLGLSFENNEMRRKFFTEELRKKLPDLKKVAGYPIGEDEEILRLSNPPYYTACPNPWTNDFIEEWSKEQKEDSYNLTEYHREPFAADVSEGKNDPIYLAHSYHTKVPFKAIMRYILHYTEPGDVVFDGFSGSGMTGVAGNLCGDFAKVKELVDDNRENHYKVGKRNVILNDLSPIASHISSSFNHIEWDLETIEKLEMVMSTVEEKLGWMYQTTHNNIIAQKGKINYVVFSEVFVCSNCNEEVVFWNEAVDFENGIVKDTFICSNCQSEASKTKLEKVKVTKYDSKSNEVFSQNKIIPVRINYTYQNKRFEKEPDVADMKLLEKIDEYDTNYNYPNNDLIFGDEIGRLKGSLYTKVSHLLSQRNNVVLYEFLKEIDEHDDNKIKKMGLFLLTASITNLSWMYRWRANNKGGTTSGTYYICSTPQENNPFIQLKRKLKDFKKINSKGYYNNIVSVQSSTQLLIKDSSIDYIFIDPPFGANLMYSELNFLWESWLKVFTNNENEAIINNNQRKKIDEYKSLMHECFKENYRILKPGRWITVEFSNSKASVWNAIREAIEKAGFVIANVSSLDKKQGSFKAVTTTTAVRQDLVISAYKPHNIVIEQIKNEQNTEESAWTFVKQHLEQLPIFIGKKGNAEIIIERTPRILFDRMVAYHVQNGYTIPISSGDFQAGVEQRFPMRDGMAFLETQVAEYDKKRISKEFTQMSLFVADENSAIEWLRQQLMKKPQTRQELHPNFMKEIQHIAKHEELPELDALLEQNFLVYDNAEEVPSQIHTYLSSDYKELRNLAKDDYNLKLKAKDRWYVPDPNKQADLEKLREKSLLREFEAYREIIIESRKKLKQFRMEAIRAGFKRAWSEKNYHTIVSVGERLPEIVLQEDDKLLMYFDNSRIRLGM